jgi:hypothetical protein
MHFCSICRSLHYDNLVKSQILAPGRSSLSAAALAVHCGQRIQAFALQYGQRLQALGPSKKCMHELVLLSHIRCPTQCGHLEKLFYKLITRVQLCWHVLLCQVGSYSEIIDASQMIKFLVPIGHANPGLS